MLYRCYVRGENFLTDEGGVPERIGFYTTRWVDANCPEDAETRVVAMLREEPELQRPDWCDGVGPRAMVYVEEIVLVESDARGVNQGFVFFPEDGA